MKRFLPKTNSNPKGFTLVELLVVISIIAVLSVVGITVFSSTQKSSRDARRRLDIEAISKALEAGYNAEKGTYPTSLATAGMFASGSEPKDPVNAASKVYTNTLTATGYTTCAFMESGSGGNSTDNVFSASGTAYYCQRNQQ